MWRLCILRRRANDKPLNLSELSVNLARYGWSRELAKLVNFLCQKMSLRPNKSEKLPVKTMNIFEDLIEELKEENLIEQTVIETSLTENDYQTFSGDVIKTEIAAQTQSAESSKNESSQLEEYVLQTVAAESANQAVIYEETAQEQPLDEAEFYRRRAMEEVAFLQTVESVFGGIEREQIKTVPKPYDDFEVKKVLHSFLQLSPAAQLQEHSNAQFQLLQETESWHSSLAMRDERVMTAHLRRYCETSRPPLGAPALIALARFYRNSPYSESVRSKFDLVITRLFSKESGSEREMVFSREELTEHIRELYAEWSSVPMYATEADDAHILQTAGQFEEFIREADRVQTFDALINSNFYNRLRLFKESTNEDFYAPAVAAAGIETNIRVGNRYVELLNKEKESGSVIALEDKYGISHDQSISEATGKTLSLIELLNQKKPEPKPVEEKPAPVNTPEPEPEKAAEPKPIGKTGGKFNKLIVAAVVLAAIVFGVYFLTKSEVIEPSAAPGVPKMNLENSLLKEFLQDAYIRDGTLNGVASPAWENLSEEKKREVLKQTLKLGAEKNFKRVQLVDEKGKAVGSAEGTEILIF
jgi:hypothetical protein